MLENTGQQTKTQKTEYTKNTTRIKKRQSKIQQNKTNLVQSPFMMLSNEMRWALFYNAPENK